jgi:TRAP-type C4-dicarboxylate transport system permease small subunit
MMVLIFIDVSGRKFLNTPLYGAYEMTEFLMGTLIFSALPLVTTREDHVTIDVLDALVPRAWRRWQLTIVTTISFIVLGYIAWRLWLLSFQLISNNEVTMTLHIPHGPFARVFAAMAALAAVACLMNLWSHLAGRREPHAARPSDSAA